MGIRNLFKPHRERRKHPRQAVIETGWIRIEREASPFVCVIWDISQGGARVAVASLDAISDEFTLMLERDATCGTRCRVAWRTEEQIGLEFLENAQSILRCVEQPALRGGTMREEPGSRDL
jgi:hypothetical protein